VAGQLDARILGVPSGFQSMTYKSWSAQAWMEGAAAISRCEWILREDNTLMAELTTRMKQLHPSGKWQAEEKYEMRKRNVPSPNRADAVLGAMAAVDYEVFTKQPIDFSDWRDHSSDMQKIEEF